MRNVFGAAVSLSNGCSNCVVDSTCQDIEDGVCYDEELFAY